jgi:hypothetical protein
MLEGERGFIDVFKGAAEPDLEGWCSIRQTIWRLWSAWHQALCLLRLHPFGADALLALRRTSRRSGRHDAIECTMNELVPDILVHHRPVSPAQAKFSIEYCLAVALIDGDCGMDQFTEDRIADAQVRSLLERVTTRIDPAIRYRNGVYPGTVTLHFADGSSLSRHAEEALGHPDRPLDMDGLAKFMSAARHPEKRAARRLPCWPRWNRSTTYTASPNYFLITLRLDFLGIELVRSRGPRHLHGHPSATTWPQRACSAHGHLTADRTAPDPPTDVIRRLVPACGGRAARRHRHRAGAAAEA